MIKTKVALMIVCLATFIYGSYCLYENEWKEVDIGDEYSKSCTISLDLDGDGIKETINLNESGKYISINENDYIINKYYKDDNTTSSFRDYSKNYYYFVDLNSDGILEIIHRTTQQMISPNTNKYTIYNLKNNDLKEIGNISIIGNMPSNLYVNGNTIKFEYWPYESPKNTKEEYVFELDV